MVCRYCGIALLAALLASCNFRIDGLSSTDDAADMSVDVGNVDAAQPGSVDLAVSSLDMNAADMTMPADMTPVSCTSNCSSMCMPCCRETCSNGNNCSQSCPSSGCNCDLTCSGPKTCSFSCAGGATCTALADQSDDATMSCAAGATCWLKCGANLNKTCTLDCGAGSSCRIDCGSNVNSCDINNCPVAPTACPNNVKVCGRPCP